MNDYELIGPPCERPTCLGAEAIKRALDRIEIPATEPAASSKQEGAADG